MQNDVLKYYGVLINGETGLLSTSLRLLIWEMWCRPCFCNNIRMQSAMCHCLIFPILFAKVLDDWLEE